MVFSIKDQNLSTMRDIDKKPILKWWKEHLTSTRLDQQEIRQRGVRKEKASDELPKLRGMPVH